MGQRLLIVDSDRAFLQEQRVTLESAYEVEVISTVEGVIERLESGQFAATLIAVEVGENRGYGLCSTIRKHAELKDVKIALISSKATEDEYKRHQSLKGRADLYLHKPVAPSALVASLGGLVPPRPVDPHNPLGDLADGGPDFLDELNNLEVDELFSSSAPAPDPLPLPPVPKAPPVEEVPSPLATQRLSPIHLNPVSTAPPRTTTGDLLQAQLEGLQEKLRSQEAELHAKDETLARLQEELRHLQHDRESITVNLEALERQKGDAARLAAQLAEAQAQARRLEEVAGNEEAIKNQLRASLEEKQEHLHQIEDLGKQVAEKTQRTVEILKERDRWQAQVLELEPFKAQAESALRELREWRERAQGAETRLQTMEEMLQRLPVVEKELAMRSGELEKAKAEARSLQESMEGLAARHQELETRTQTQTTELHALQGELGTARQEMAGLEATLKGQGLQMAQLQTRIQEGEAALAGARTEADAARAQLAEAQADLATKAENLEKMGNEIFAISAQRNEIQSQLEDSEHAREQERMELMQGLDAKESELQRAAADLAQAQREGQEWQGQLAERGDRLQNLTALLDELAEKLRKGADLARG